MAFLAYGSLSCVDRSGRVTLEAKTSTRSSDVSLVWTKKCQKCTHPCAPSNQNESWNISRNAFKSQLRFEVRKGTYLGKTITSNPTSKGFSKPIFFLGLVENTYYEKPSSDVRSGTSDGSLASLLFDGPLVSLGALGIATGVVGVATMVGIWGVKRSLGVQNVCPSLTSTIFAPSFLSSSSPFPTLTRFVFLSERQAFLSH